MSRHPDLLETLRQAQRFGFFGDRAIDEAVRHAEQYVAAIDGRRGRLLDLGAGGGLPGLVIADARRDLDVVLLDRRQKRTDFLERAVRRLDLVNAAVWCGDAADVAADRSTTLDIVTARGFGPPEFTLRTAAACIGADGCIVISEPPHGDRWPAELLDELDLSPTRVGTVIRFDHR